MKRSSALLLLYLIPCLMGLMAMAVAAYDQYGIPIQSVIGDVNAGTITLYVDAHHRRVWQGKNILLYEGGTVTWQDLRSGERMAATGTIVVTRK